MEGGGVGGPGAGLLLQLPRRNVRWVLAFAWSRPCTAAPASRVLVMRAPHAQAPLLLISLPSFPPLLTYPGCPSTGGS